MKKTIVVMLAVLALTLAVAPAAFAQTACEARICELAQANEKVTKAQCLVFERTAVVAIKTEKFSTKSDYETYVKEFVASVKSECEVDHVFVTRNPKIMKQIAELSKLDDEQREEAIQKILDGIEKFRPFDKINPTKLNLGD